MSLCIALFQNNGIYVCADSRVSFDSNNTHYYVNDNCQKLRQYGDKVVFMAGDLGTVNTISDLISNDDTVENIIEKVKKQFALNQSRLKKRKPEDEGDHLGVYIFTIENGVSVFYQVYHTDKWIIDRQEVTNQCFKTMGAHSKEALHHILDILETSNEDAGKIIMDTYEHFADEMVGGNMYSYAIVPGVIKNFEIQKIKDHKPLTIFNQRFTTGTYHATLDGTLTANRANIIGNIDCSSLKISGTDILTELYQIRGSAIQGSTIQNLNANNITTGKLKANLIDTVGLKAQYIQDDVYANTTAHLNRNELIFSKSSSEYFGIFLDSSLMKMHYSDRNFLQVNLNKTKPQGTWNFKDCTIEEFPNVTTTAVFG